MDLDDKERMIDIKYSLKLANFWLGAIFFVLFAIFTVLVLCL